MFFARNELIEKRPEVVRAFLKGWMDTIAFMKANKDKTVEITSKVINVPPSVAARAYDEQIGTFSTDGTFDPEGGGGAQGVVHRDGAVEGNPGGRRDVHDAVRAGEIDAAGRGRGLRRGRLAVQMSWRMARPVRRSPEIRLAQSAEG